MNAIVGVIYGCIGQCIHRRLPHQAEACPLLPCLLGAVAAVSCQMCKAAVSWLPRLPGSSVWLRLKALPLDFILSTGKSADLLHHMLVVCRTICL